MQGLVLQISIFFIIGQCSAYYEEDFRRFDLLTPPSLSESAHRTNEADDTIIDIFLKKAMDKLSSLNENSEMSLFNTISAIHEIQGMLTISKLIIKKMLAEKLKEFHEDIPKNTEVGNNDEDGGVLPVTRSPENYYLYKQETYNGRTHVPRVHRDGDGRAHEN